MFNVYAKQTAVQKAEEYFSQLASRHLEGMGLLVGEVCEHKGEQFIIVSEFITSATDSSAVSVRFSPNAFEKIAEELQKSGEIVVGWCHSHPGYGCFLSTTDVSTQRRFFNETFHIASVFDPLVVEDFGTGQVMAKRFYRLVGNSYEEVSFAVIKSER